MKGHFWERLDYFFLHSLFFCGVVGTAFFPVIGTLVGMCIGGGIGVIGGLVNMMIVARSRSAFFDEEFDVDGYGRWLAVRVGVCTTLVTAALSIVFVSLTSPRASILREVLFLSSLFTFGGGLISAIIARDYPLWLIQQMAKAGQLYLDPDSIPSRPRVRSAIWKLYRSGSRLLRLWIGVGGVALIMIFKPDPSSYYQPDITTRNLFLGAVASEVIWVCLAIMNGFLLTGLKQILKGYFPDFSGTRSRHILTGVSFVLTLWITRGTLFIAPLNAFYTAYYVYHTLALPDKSPEKAKRKEKNALTLEEEIDEEGEMLLVEEERLLEEQKR